MANIILINDQDQEQTLTGVSKLVTRSTDGDVEFSLGAVVVKMERAGQYSPNRA